MKEDADSELGEVSAKLKSLSPKNKGFGFELRKFVRTMRGRS